MAAARFVQANADSLSVSLPAGPDDIAPVPARKPPRGRGRGAWLLRLVVAHSPLRVWTGGGLAPRLLVRLAQESGHAGTLIPAWTTAAVRQRNAAWAGALLAAGADTPALLSVLPPGEAARRVLERLAGEGLTAGTFALLEALGGDWPDAVSRAVLAALPSAGLARAAQVTIAARLGPGLADQTAATLPAFRFATLIDLLAARRDMRKELP